ncbi:sulfatase-like hydrolase/transferase [Kiritimatiellaeota bacterium B1221]|nr:sulfatase-like hydrolase/transferase [Kiritimatiellaeota bacterium B1221]
MKKPTRPHILLITTDQQRHDAMGINGNRDIETPFIDSLAARGVNFERGYSTCPVCIPARRTLLSGLHPNSHGLKRYQDGLDWDPDFTLPGILGDAGYQTQLVGKLHMHPMGKRYGFDHMVLSETSNWRPGSETQNRNDYVRWLKEQGIDDHPASHGISGNGRLVHPYPLEERYHQTNWLAREAVQFLTEDRDKESPFFLHLSFFHPHPPFIPPQSYFDRYEQKDLPGPTCGEWVHNHEVQPGVPPDAAVGPFDPEIMKRAQAGYYALINHIDDCIAHVIERWMEYGNDRAKEPLYIIYTSDHGEMLGDHHLFRKSLGYEASSHVPLFVSGFNVDIEKGSTEALHSWEDILPTIAELAGIEIPGPVDGKSMVPALKGEKASGHDCIYGMCNGAHNNFYLVKDQYKYIWFPKTNEEQLFDLKSDPKECKDLSADESLLPPMRKLMAEKMDEEDRATYNIENLTPCKNQPPKVLFG